MNTRDASANHMQSAGILIIRSALAANLVWIGALKFYDYEVDNIRPLMTSSPLLSWLTKKLGEKKTAQLIGVTEITFGSLIVAKPLAPRASTLGSIGAIGTFSTTLSFLATTPGVWQEGYGKPKLSMVGQFLLKDSVLFGAAVLTAADSLRHSHRRRLA